MLKLIKATTESLMSHSNLRYENIKVGNKVLCLNFNLLGLCSDPHCSYRHTKANPTNKSIKAVKQSWARHWILHHRRGDLQEMKASYQILTNRVETQANNPEQGTTRRTPNKWAGTKKHRLVNVVSSMPSSGETDSGQPQAPAWRSEHANPTGLQYWMQ